MKLICGPALIVHTCKPIRLMLTFIISSSVVTVSGLLFCSSASEKEKENDGLSRKGEKDSMTGTNRRE